MKFTKLVLFSVCVAALAGCNSTNEVTGLPSKTPTTTTGGTTTQDIKQFVTTGAGNNFNNMTGSWSEMALDPVTRNPGIVYYDRSQTGSSVVIGALKYAGGDASGNFKVEVIDYNVGTAGQACGAGATSAACIGAPNVLVPTVAQAQIYDLKYLTVAATTSPVVAAYARPVIAYAYGTGGTGASITGKSIRFAEKLADGSWIVTTPVTGAAINTLVSGGPAITTLEYAIKGIRLLVDDSNRVHLWAGIYGATLNNSAYIYMMRKADGTWVGPTAITTMTGTGTPTAALSFVSGAPTVAAGIGLIQSGAAWCKYATGGTSADATGAIVSLATTDNTPAASTQGFFLKCFAANSDGSCSSWQGLDFAAACGGACSLTSLATTAINAVQFSRSDIAIDPLNGKIFSSNYFTAPAMTPATGIYSALSPAACDAGLSTTLWSAARMHPTAGQGQLGLRNATDGTNSFLASLTGAAGASYTINKQPATLLLPWNTSPDQATVESTTNTVGGGFSYDATTGVLWGSYGALTAGSAGGLGQDLKAFGAYSVDISTTTGIINNIYVDQTGFVGQATAVPMLDSVIAPNGTVGYAYFYQEQGTAGPNSHLYYGVRGGTALAPAFGEKIVANSIQGATTFTAGNYPALTFDTNSNPVIAFLDNGVAANTGYLMVARSNNAGANFSLDRVDGSTSATNTVGQFPSVKTTSSNTIGVAYYDFSPTIQRLKFAKREKNGAWRRFVVDGSGSANANGCGTATGATTGMYADLQWTSTGRPVIVYQSQIAGVKTLRMAVATEAETSATYTWTCTSVDIALQGTNTRGEGIDFVLDASDNPYIIHQDQGINALRYVTCPTGGGVLNCAATGTIAFTAERLNYLIGTVTSITSKPTIRVTSAGKVFVAFYSTADQGMYLATKPAATSGSWSTAEALELPTQGVTYTSTAGQYASMNLNSSGAPLIFYRSLENWIKYFSRETY